MVGLKAIRFGVLRPSIALLVREAFDQGIHGLNRIFCT